MRKKDVVLIELAQRWEREAIKPDTQDGSEEALILNAKDQAYRKCKRDCADALRRIVYILGDS